MIIEKLNVGVLGVNCYIVMDEQSKETAIIDPGGDSYIIESNLEKLGAKTKYIILTHAHYDHLGACSTLSKKYKVPVLVHKNELEAIESGYELFAMDDSSVCDNSLNESIKLNLGEHTLVCIETPGHSPGGVCIYIENDKAIFTGDTLFQGTIGRTDLPFANMKTLLDSVKNKLFVLNEETVVYPGHGYTSTIGREVQWNPYF